MYRHFTDVVHSKLNRFRAQIDHLRAIVDRRVGDWRSELLSDETRSVVCRFFSDNMSRSDAAALMWYARNMLFFELRLNEHADVVLCKYEDLVKSPSAIMRELYSFLRAPYPGDVIIRTIDTKSVGGGEKIVLSPDVIKCCSDLAGRFEEAYLLQRKRSCTNATEYVAMDAR
jgi:hypothetical protein